MTDTLDEALAVLLGRPVYDTINKHLADGQRAEAALARVRTLHRETCPVARDVVSAGFTCTICDALDEQPRTTVNKRATCSDSPLREQLEAAIGELTYYERDDASLITDAILAVVTRDTAQLRRERDMALTAAREARGVVDQVRAALTGSFMAGPGAVLVVRVDTVRAALEPKETR